jgi:CyaY protein
MKMDDTEFNSIVQNLLLKIADKIESDDVEGLIDVDFNTDIITLATSAGVFVINKHSAAKEIWLASPISGPYHFSYNAGKWQSRYGKDLITILETELNIKFNEILNNDI